MPLQASIETTILKFKKPATTSRGAILQREINILKILNTSYPQIIGYGECAPLKGLSIDDVPNYKDVLLKLVEDINNGKHSKTINLDKFPSIKFGLETALLDLKNGGKRILYNSFYAIGKQGIPINGLVWMDTFEEMKKEVVSKLEQGFTCIKIKIGAIKFEEECALLQFIRNHPIGKDITLRLDANGAFTKDNVWQRLDALNKFNIHSIEQPIKANQIDLLKEVCKKSPIPIALDEELIGIMNEEKMEALLSTVKPHFIVLKPNLLGGINQCEKWISLAKKYNVKWWLTSALESNIGLNAIAQYAATLQTHIPQGLGTGHLYQTNFMPFTHIKSGYLWRDMGNNNSDTNFIQSEGI